MPYDPNLPAANSPNSSAQMRAQLNGLKDLIDAVPTITGAQIDAVNTLPPGQPASVSVSLSGGVLHLSFDLPQGPEGTPGSSGTNGSDGQQGPPGNDGPPFTNFSIFEVATLPPGSDAAVSAFFDGTAVRLTFGIPRGADGTNGEVTLAQLSDAILSTSNNSNAVATLGLTVSDPPTQAEVQQIADKIDELINALRR